MSAAKQRLEKFAYANAVNQAESAILALVQKSAGMSPGTRDAHVEILVHRFGDAVVNDVIDKVQRARSTAAPARAPIAKVVSIPIQKASSPAPAPAPPTVVRFVGIEAIEKAMAPFRGATVGPVSKVASKSALSLSDALALANRTVKSLERVRLWPLRPGSLFHDLAADVRDEEQRRSPVAKSKPSTSTRIAGDFNRYIERRAEGVDDARDPSLRQACGFGEAPPRRDDLWGPPGADLNAVLAADRRGAA